MLNDALEMFFDGSIRFCLQNGFVSDFTEACRMRKLRLYALFEKNGDLYGKVCRKDFAALCDIAEKKGMQLRVTGQSGVYFFLRRNRLRWGIPVGILLSLLLTGVLSSMIWQVQVSGCEKLSEEYVRSYFAAQGVRTGVFRKGIDVVSLRDRALYEIEQLLWVSLYFDGCVACIEVRERTVQPSEEYVRPINVIADYGGEIVRADIFEGEPYARIGKAVAKGDLLAGGALMMPGGGVRFVHAKADVIARTHRQLQCSVAFTDSVEIVEKCTQRTRFVLFGLQTPMLPTFGAECSERSESNPSAGGVILPIGLLYEGYRRMTQQCVTLPQAVAVLQVFAEYALQETELLQDKKILDRTMQLDVRQDGVCLNGAYVCEENIGREVPLSVEMLP